MLANAPGSILQRVQMTGALDNDSDPTNVNPFPVALDYRPADGRLYVQYSDGRLYIPGSDGALALVSDAPYPVTADVESIDFNPVTDVIRVLSVSTDRGSFRISPSGATLLGSDTLLTYADGDANAGLNPIVDAVAYTNGAGDATTTAYVIDSAQRVLTTLGGANGVPSPNDGKLFTVGALGITALGGNGVGLDIPTAASTSLGFVSVNNTPTESQATIYQIDLGSGAASSLGVVNARVVDLAVLPDTGL